MSFTQIIGAMNMQPQQKTVLKHLISRGTISPLEALGTYGIYRLAATIEQLRKMGYDVATEMRKDERGKRYARYSLSAMPIAARPVAEALAA